MWIMFGFIYVKKHNDGPVTQGLQNTNNGERVRYTGIDKLHPPLTLKKGSRVKAHFNSKKMAFQLY